jgi:hypothetical protein
MKPGLKLHQGYPAGRDPREMTQDQLREAGHEPMSPLQALRAHCLDCCAQQAKEVALCPAVGCPSWAFRMGTDPWRQPASAARREAARRTMAKLNARRNRGGAEPSPTATEHGTEPSLASELTPAPTWATGGGGRATKRSRTVRTEQAVNGTARTARSRPTSRWRSRERRGGDGERGDPIAGSPRPSELPEPETHSREAA